MYILLSDNRVSEIIPDSNPFFPGIPITQRYELDFVAKLLHVADDTPVEENDIYDPEMGTFSKPPVPEYVPPEEEIVPEGQQYSPLQELAQQVTDEELARIELGQQVTDLELMVIGGGSNV